jgi:hypothetical protein
MFGPKKTGLSFFFFFFLYFGLSHFDFEQMHVWNVVKLTLVLVWLQKYNHTDYDIWYLGFRLDFFLLYLFG